jgi:hypothetical protein
MAEISASGALRKAADQRTALRKKAFLRGKIAYDGGAQSCECTIRNISATGARVEIAVAQIVPRQLFLIDMRSGIGYQCEMKWRVKGELGLHFLRTIPLDGDMPSDLRYLKLLWSGSSLVGDPDLGAVVRAEQRSSDAAPVVNMPDVTPEMIGAGVAAYAAWKPSDVAWRHSESDMVRSVFLAMLRTMRR